MSFATVAVHPTTGAVVTESTKKPGWGRIRLDFEYTSFSNGIIGAKKNSAFLSGKLEDLAQFKVGQRIPGIVQRQTSFRVFWVGQEPVINPETREVALKNGKEYYQNNVFMEDASQPKEVFIENPMNVEVEEEVES